jgi:hypothetical protein
VPCLAARVVLTPRPAPPRSVARPGGNARPQPPPIRQPNRTVGQLNPTVSHETVGRFAASRQPASPAPASNLGGQSVQPFNRFSLCAPAIPGERTATRATSPVVAPDVLAMTAASRQDVGSVATIPCAEPPEFTKRLQLARGPIITGGRVLPVQRHPALPRYRVVSWPHPSLAPVGHGWTGAGGCQPGCQTATSVPHPAVERPFDYHL